MSRINFISIVFDKNTEWRHKYFECFFTLVNQRFTVPNKKV